MQGSREASETLMNVGYVRCGVSRDEEPHWYALHTKAKHEKKVAAELQARLDPTAMQLFVPTVRELHRWSDRRQVVEIPLFSCYVLVYAVASPEVQSAILRTRGVFRIVSSNGQPSPIPNEEIDAIRTLVGNSVPFWPHGFIKVGERVRIRSGSLDGLEGIFLGRKGESKLVFSVDLIQQSLAMCLEGYDIERV